MHLSDSKQWFRWVPSILLAVALFIVSTLPGEQLPQVRLVASPDKYAHFIAYALFTLVLGWSLRGIRSLSGLSRIGIAFLISTLYGACMEYIQYAFFPGRYFEVWDIVANISGALVAAVFLVRINNIKILSA